MKLNNFQIHMRVSSLVLIFSFLFSSCAVKKVSDIEYSAESSLKLNVFADKNIKDAPVLIFVHGGNWNSGNKDQYGFLGRNFARKRVVTVIPNYTLSPNANYAQMTQEITEAIKWVKANISSYGGDPSRIFISGHSAGAHLGTLAVLDHNYLPPNSVNGIILIDGAGLDMHNYLKANPPTTSNNYLSTWGKDPEVWKKASPVYFLNKNSPPFLIFVGEKTYPSIETANNTFLAELQKYQPNVRINYQNKKHVGMITQFIWPWNKNYDLILEFISKN